MAHGATHYTHWFVPMTGVHGGEARLVPEPDRRGQDDRGVLRQEPAPGRAGRVSSFPSGGIRATFEARGYTAWDVTSPIFLQVEPNGVTLTIPTAYVSFTGEALDHKIPLLRSQEALGKQALRVLRWFGNDDRQARLHQHRPRAGVLPRRPAPRRAAPGPRAHRPHAVRRPVAQGPGAGGPVLRPHPRADPRVHDGPRPRAVAAGHPVQDPPQRGGARPVRDGARVYEPTSVGSDHNMIVMSTMRRLAPQHGLMFLIHEKPFAGINGSGKHNNWSMATDEGENLLDPGNDPHANAQFLAFLMAVIRGVNVHADLIRASIADAGQDHRLGANEAPPAIMSIFLGSQLEDVIGAARARAPRPSSKKGGSRGARRDLAAGPAQGRHRPQPDLAVRVHRQQVRVPRRRLLRPDLLAADGAQHRRGRLACRPGRRAGEARARRLRRPDDDPVAHRQGEQAGPVRGQRLLRGVACRGRPPRAAEQPDHRRRAAVPDHGQGEGASSPGSACCPSASSPPATEILWERYVKVQNIEAQLRRSTSPRR